MFLNDSRYNYLEDNGVNTGNTKIKNGMSVCFTGKLNTMSRSKAAKMAEDAGFEVKNAVNKGLTYLVTNDPNTNSSKGKAAKAFGTKIISEDEFMSMCNYSSTDVMDL